MENDIAIKVDHVSKNFKLPHEKTTSIKGAVVNFYRQKKTFESQQVLKDVTFEIKKGEFFGIVGRNGSGKSTLLKMLAGIYSPSNGSIQVNGKLTPFIELGVGFNPELSGRENVYLNGALLGFNRKEVQIMYSDIVEFAELEKFMDQKLKNYSSGMQVRLAFSIAIRAKSDILLIDEVLAVGDASFQKKCFDYFGKLKSQNQTIVLVSHDMAAVEKFCERAMLISNGEVIFIGDPYTAASKYAILNQDEVTPPVQSDSKLSSTQMKLGRIAKIISVNRVDEQDKDKRLIIAAEILSKNTDAIVGHSIIRADNTYISGFNTLNQIWSAPTVDQTKIICDIDISQLNTSIYDRKFMLLDFKANSVAFSIKRSLDNSYDGIIKLQKNWAYETH